MHSPSICHLKFVLFAGVVLGLTIPVQAQNPSPHNVSTIGYYDAAVVAGAQWSGSAHGCPCPYCSARRKKLVGLHDFVHGFQTIPTVQWLIDDGYSTRSPDHGFARITKRPIERSPISYTRYWPAQWYGASRYGAARQIPRYPIAARPTDTTQLGYYYQHVPQWQPMPGMSPAAPDPDLFHTRECSVMGYSTQWVHTTSSAGGAVNCPADQGKTVAPQDAPTANEKMTPVPDPRVAEQGTN